MKVGGLSAFYLVSNLCFTAENRTAVQNCHAAGGQLKSTICTSIVHGVSSVAVTVLMQKLDRGSTVDGTGKT
jgi:hypothetical protein